MPEDNALASSALHKFLLIHRHLRQYARTMDDQGLRPRQFAVLRFLLENGPATVTEIQAHLYTSASTASAVLTQLEEAGYASRTRSDEDSRVVIIDLTAAGRELASRAPLGGIVLLRRRLPTLPEDRLRQIDEALSEIMQLMEVTEAE